MEFKITMTINNKNTSNQEQIKNRDLKFYSKLKKFLERDDFGFFKLKAKRSLNRSIRFTDTKIQNLLDLKKRSEQIYEKMLEKKKNLVSLNKKLKESLIQKLESEVTE